MTNERLDAAVQRLFTDRRFLGRFRTDPTKALAGFDLSQAEIEAIKRGDAQELVGLGLDPAIAWPQPANAGALQTWLLRNAARLAPAAVLAALALAWPATSQAVPRRGGPPRAVPGLQRARGVLIARARGNGRARARVARRYENVRPGPGDLPN